MHFPTQCFKEKPEFAIVERIQPQHYTRCFLAYMIQRFQENDIENIKIVSGSNTIINVTILKYQSATIRTVPAKILL